MKRVLLVCFFSIGICSILAAQTITGDATFGSGSPAGTALFSGIQAGTFDQGIAFQTDGKIIITSGTSNGLARLLTNGSLDNTFGGGWVTAGNYAFGDVIVQADGKVLAVGKPTVISHNDLYVWRLDGNGSFDNGFGTGGRVGDSSIGAGYGHIALQSGTKIIWSGSAGVKRLNLTDGSLDGSFGNAGFVRIAQLPLTPLALAVDNSGNILLGGLTKNTSRLAIARLTPNGQPDATFGNNGVDSLLPLKSTGLTTTMKIGFSSTGRIVIVSDCDSGSNNRVVCLGVKSNGSPDSTFGLNSIFFPTWNTVGGYQFSGGMAIAGNDKIYIAATVNDNASAANGNDIAIQKLNANGSFDATGGIAKLDIGHASDQVQAIGIEPDGKLVVNGSTAGQELAARYNDGPTGIRQAEILTAISLYPNPVRRNATCSFRLDAPSPVSICIYAQDGRKVRTVIEKAMTPAGVFKKEISTAGLLPGIYFLSIIAGDSIQSSMFEQQ